MREHADFTREAYELTKVALERSDVPAEALALIFAWIEGEGLLVDDREDVGGINFCRMDAKAVAPLPHILASFFARRPYKRKAGHSPRWNGFYLLLYRGVEEGWKLERLRRDSYSAQFIPVFAARSKTVEEINKRLANDLGRGREAEYHDIQKGRSRAFAMSLSLETFPFVPGDQLEKITSANCRSYE